MKNYAHFRQGILYDVQPRSAPSLYEDRGIAYRADFFICDGILYDLSVAADVAAIPVVETPASWDVVSTISYILKIRCGLVEDPALIPAFVDKTFALMQASNILWRRSDYLQVIRNYYRVGLTDLGNIAEVQFRNTYPALFSRPEDRLAEAEHLQTKYYFENQNRKFQEYQQVKSLLPDLVPDTPKGYYQIRTRGTKRFLKIRELAESSGITIDTRKHLHYCEKIQMFVELSFVYSEPDSRGYKKLVSCCCSSASENCKSCNSYGLQCCYP